MMRTDRFLKRMGMLLVVLVESERLRPIFEDVVVDDDVVRGETTEVILDFLESCLATVESMEDEDGGDGEDDDGCCC